jgi:hypothetical protein
MGNRRREELTDDLVLRIVDSCFHYYASNYRQEAKERAEKLLKYYSGEISAEELV